MWQVATVIIAVLYVVYSGIHLVLGAILSRDPVEFQPPGGWWLFILPRISEVGLGLLFIYFSVRLFRHEATLRIGRHEATALAQALIGGLVLALGWLSLFVGLGYRPSNIDQALVTLLRWYPWGIVAPVLCWMLVGLLVRPWRVRPAAGETSP